MNLLEKGYELLIRLLCEDASPAGQVLYYPKAGQPQDLANKCWVGRTVFSRVPQDGGPAIVFGDRDYLIPVAFLRCEPKRGDKLTEVINGKRITFEVISQLNEPEWRYADPGRKIYRIHTKEVCQ